jgi:3-oxoacyl-[acyl-carrier protein] reductase
MDDEWDQVLQVSVRSTVYTLRHASPHMGPGSSVVNISSTTASRPHRNRGAYPTSKGAVNALTTSLAVDLGPPGIRVNAVAPGSIWTPMGRNVLIQQGDDPAQVRQRRAAETTLLQQVGTAWDVADAVEFLCSPASRWITGQVLTVDGGGSVQWGTRPLHVDLEASA